MPRVPIVEAQCPGRRTEKCGELESEAEWPLPRDGPRHKRPMVFIMTDHRSLAQLRWQRPAENASRHQPDLPRSPAPCGPDIDPLVSLSLNGRFNDWNVSERGVQGRMRATRNRLRSSRLHTSAQWRQRAVSESSLPAGAVAGQALPLAGQRSISRAPEKVSFRGGHPPQRAANVRYRLPQSLKAEIRWPLPAMDGSSHPGPQIATGGHRFQEP